MLKIEVGYQNHRTGITLKERSTGFLSKRLIKALTISVFIHCGCLFLFKVHMLDERDHLDQLSCADVRIEHFLDPIGTSQAKAEYELSNELDPWEKSLQLEPALLQLAATDIQDIGHNVQQELILDPLSTEKHDYLSSRPFTKIPLYQDPIDFSLYYYPLKIELKGEFSDLPLISDGCHLFKNQKFNKRKPLSHTVNELCYRVRVSTQTGKITWLKRRKNSIHSKIEKIAERILKSLVFDTHNLQDPLTGELVITLYGTHREIKSLMHKRQKDKK